MTLGVIDNMHAIQRLKEILPQCSDKQRLLATYLIDHYKQAAFMSSVELAKELGVSNPTVTRFAFFLGYKGYPELQKDLQQTVINQISTMDQMNYFSNESKFNNLDDLESSINQIPLMYKNRDKEGLAKAARLIFESESVYLLGRQMSSIFASFTEYELSKVKKGVVNISDWNMPCDDMLRQTAGRSCAIVFVLQRYPQKTLQIIRLLDELHIPMIIFTDSILFPYAQCAEQLLIVPTNYISFINPVAVGLCLINSLIYQVVNLDFGMAKENIRRFENFVERNGIYYKKDAVLSIIKTKEESK